MTRHFLTILLLLGSFLASASAQTAFFSLDSTNPNEPDGVISCFVKGGATINIEGTVLFGNWWIGQNGEDIVFKESESNVRIIIEKGAVVDPVGGSNGSGEWSDEAGGVWGDLGENRLARMPRGAPCAVPTHLTNSLNDLRVLTYFQVMLPRVLSSLSSPGALYAQSDQL